MALHGKNTTGFHINKTVSQYLSLGATLYTPRTLRHAARCNTQCCRIARGMFVSYAYFTERSKHYGASTTTTVSLLHLCVCTMRRCP